MKQGELYSEKITQSISNPEQKRTNVTNTNSNLIRVEEKQKNYLWVQPEEILFIKSADHYVKVLIQHGAQKKWAMRHSTIKDLVAILNYNFIRLNKFYMINRIHFSHVDETSKTLFLNDGFPIPVSHSISRFMINMLKC